MTEVADPTNNAQQAGQMNGTTMKENAPVQTLTQLESQEESFHSAESSVSNLEPQETPASSAKTTEVEKLEEEFNLPTDGPLKVPIPKPLPKCKPVTPTKLTGEQESKYATVLSKVSSWQSLPTTTVKGAPQAPITEYERMWLTRECLLRYLRATKWNVSGALGRLQSTLSWRREYKADEFTFDYISPENETGKQVVLGFDNDARPCLFLNPAKQNTDMSDRQIHHLCFMLDRTIDMMPAGTENATLIINFKGAGSGKVPTMGQARQVLNILQGHNPERLGKALISQLPWYVNTFFKLISPFIDPVTRDKMNFNQPLRNFIPPENLWDHHEGDLRFEYDHSAYWPALEKLVTARRDAWRSRWEKAGKRIGEYEEYLKGGSHMSLQEEIDAAASAAASAATSANASQNPSQADLLTGGVAKLSVIQ